MRRTTIKTLDRKRETGNPKPKTGNRPPLAETVIPLNNRGTRNWLSLTDEALVSFAKKFIKEKGITGRKELQKADWGLYYVLKKRGLLDRTGLKKKRRSWTSMSDEELIDHAKKFMKKNGITGRSELSKVYRRLYRVLSKRGLADKVGFEEKKRKSRPWKNMNNAELIGHAKKFMNKKGIRRKKELQKADRGLYLVLLRRELLDKVEFKEKQRPWKKMKDEELIELSRRIMDEEEISGRGELKKADSGLYEVLFRRRLLGKLGLEEKRRKMRHWKKMADEEIIEYAKKIMEKQGISARFELQKADPGLYTTLRKRGLLDKIGFDEKRKEQRSWNKMEDEELIKYSKIFLERKGINMRYWLQKADPGLYAVLSRRKLLDHIFSPIDQSQSERAIEQIIDFTASFGERR